MPKFVVEPLSRTHMLNVYPLVHLAVPTLDMCAWRRFVRLALDGRRGSRAGILVAKRAARRHICGLVCYRRETDLILGLPDMIAGLDRRSAFNHWVDVTFSANESLLKPSHEFAH